MKAKLVRYDEITREMFEEFIVEWETSGELIVPSIIDRNSRSFDELLSRWQFEETDEVYDEGLVKATLFFLIDEDRILGAIHLRQELNDFLLNYGGHIGYGVRITERNKGYANLMLSYLLDRLKELNYKRVLLTCDDSNLGSSRTIEKNRGILENKIIFDGKLTRRYWIDL